jgi:hypothetical protein
MRLFSAVIHSLLPPDFFTLSMQPLHEQLLVCR